MEELTKHQIVLVTLLVSFVTSIATGIFTVALMEQAPPGVTQTINNVVERTVEKVVQTENQAAVSEVKVIKEEDLVMAAVEKGVRSLVRVKGTFTADPAIFVGLGVILTKEGVIAADKTGVVEGGVYTAVLADGKTVDLDLVARNDNNKIVYFKIKQPADKKDAVSFTPADLGNSEAIKVGQSVLALGGETRDILSRGTVTSLVKSEGKLTSIETDITLNQAIAPLIDLQGKLIGLEMRRSWENDARMLFIPINDVKDQLKAATSTVAVQ